MAKLTITEQQKAQCIQIFEKNDQIHLLKNALALFLIQILHKHPYLRLPEMKIIATESLRHQIYDQDPNAESETLNIHIKGWDVYIWRALDGYWCLDDFYQTSVEIVEQILTQCPLFSILPKNVRELKNLLEMGMISEQHLFLLPKFSEISPHDCREVLSWDGRYLLTGNQIGNLKLYTYKQWEELIERENTLFRKGFEK
jgi:muconolactone delta-isomerase